MIPTLCRLASWTVGLVWFTLCRDLAFVPLLASAVIPGLFVALFESIRKEGVR